MAGKKVGVLALQGAFIEHEKALHKCGALARQIRTAEELNEIDGLIIPGGESTTIGKLMQAYGLVEKIQSRHTEGMPIWGTCAGMILLAREIVEMDQVSLNLMDIAVRRNGFGRQVDSFETELQVEGIDQCRGVFIRAPYVERVWGETRILAYHQDKIVMVREGNLLATAFHPELTDDPSIHGFFLGML
ncbi:MAG: pyridoxal 5'-phosphate synthase glutaminase subunit PdxT [Syntrophomonadaceae bacterium]|nr:pyridoxal 5'-phosphate synthase glutaminase subunit PdxT [Syntrophomonadaceae bacterium]